MARRSSEGAEIDMTPMIDVVFQLIIFFIVTINMEQKYNEEIILADGKHGPAIEGDQATDRTMVVEIDKKGRVSMRKVALTHNKLKAILRNRYKRMGAYPVLIRADEKTQHIHVKTVMDICSSSGIWQISFAAVKEHKVEKKK